MRLPDAPGAPLSTSRVNHLKVQQAVRALLLAIGEDPAREGLQETPRRVADFWREFIDYQPGRLGTSFTSQQVDQLVVVSGMRVWSMCEHHLLPFWCDVAVGYLSESRQLGLSKFGRIAKKFARRLQVQERLVEEIAAEVALLTGSANVAVLARGVHTCMLMRGIEMPATMTSSALAGSFREQPEQRAEFMRLALALARSE